MQRNVLRAPPSPTTQAATLLQLLKPHRRLCALALALSLLSRGAGLVLPCSSRYLLDRVLAARNLGPLPALLAVVLLASAVQGLAGFALARTLGKAAEEMIAAYRQRVQELVGRLPLAFFDAHSTGELAARIMKDAGGVRDLLGPAAIESVGSLLTGLLAIPWLLHLSLRLAVPSLAYLAGAALVVRARSRGLKPAYERCAMLTAKLTSRLTEALGAARMVKIYTAEAREAAVIRAGALQLADSEIAAQTGQARLALLTHAMLLPGEAAILLFGTREVAAGRMTVGSLVAFLAVLAYAGVLARHVGGLQSVFARALASLARSEELMSLKAEGTELERTWTMPAAAPDVVFENVTFGYYPGRPVVHSIDFSIMPGTVTALVGASGAGKSTLLSLVCGFYKPFSGRILVSGRDLATLELGPYRRRLGLVPQEPFLFSDTIAANVLFARPGATALELEQALAASYAEDFARRQSEGAQTTVGERGVKLSGGQQQRLCLARAVLANPSLLLLDEATSALDAESEAFIQRGMETLRRGRTTLVIAHRLSTIRAADQILVLEAGRIVERGTHDALLAAGGAYSRLARLAIHSDAE